MNNQGLLLVNKSRGSTSFKIVNQLRRLTKIEKIGHAGTLDPFATGVMVMLVGRDFTRRSDQFLTAEKEYRAILHLGVTTDTYDIDGQISHQSPLVPTYEQIQSTIALFQGDILQTPPMFSAKKIKGKKLYDLARKGIVVEREAVSVRIEIRFIRYEYPELEIEATCSKGTYIRSLAHDIGEALGCGAHLSSLIRLRSGPFTLDRCIDQENLNNPEFDIRPHLQFI